MSESSRRALLARVAAAKADMVARGEWRGLGLDRPPPAPDRAACAGCGGDGGSDGLAVVRHSRLEDLHLCDGCRERWRHNWRWRDALVDRLVKAGSR